MASTTPPSSVTTTNADQRALDPVTRGFERVAEALRTILRRIVLLAIVASVAAMTISTVVWERTAPLDTVDLLALTILAGMLLIPSGLLLLYAFAIRQVLQIPRMIREYAGQANEHRAELLDLSRELQSKPGVRGAWKTTRTLSRARGDLIAFIPAVRMLNPVFTLLALLAIPASVFVIGLALVSLTVWAMQY